MTSKLNTRIFLDLTSCLGLFVLVLGFWMINREFKFPGIWALMPVSAVILIIIAGPNACVNRLLLSNKFIVWVGLISYPLYLWHWPLLSFTRVIEDYVPNIFSRVFIVAISVVLAWLTYALVERPIRNRQSGGVITIGLVLCMIIIGYLGFNIVTNNGYSSRLKDKEAFLAYFDNSLPLSKYAHTHGIFESFRTECDFYDFEGHRYGRVNQIRADNIDASCYKVNSEKQHLLFIWGDSHAQQLNYGLKKNLPKEWHILQVASSGCYAGIPKKELNINYCDKSNITALDSIKENKPDVVIVAQTAGHNATIALDIDIKLKGMGVRKVIFVGPVPHWIAPLPRIIARRLWNDTPERTFIGSDQTYILSNPELMARFTSNGLIYADVLSLFCNADGCLTRIGEDRVDGITSFDYSHLTKISSDYVARNLLVNEITRSSSGQ